MDLSRITTLLIDGDGVLWRDNFLLPGVRHFLEFLVKKQFNWALLTNNNMRTVQDYVDMLQGFDIEAEESIIFTSNTITAAYALKHFGKGAALHVIGMEGLKKTLRDEGFIISDGESLPLQKVSAVVAGEDLDINYEKIKVAMRLILSGAEFIATNTDSSHPAPEGINPGTGLVVGALQATTKTEPTVMGKPQSMMFKMAMKKFDVIPENTLMIGDTLETDILGASRLGIQTALILTGVSSEQDIPKSEIEPDYIFQNAMSLHEAFINSI